MIVDQIASALAAAQSHHHVDPELLHELDRKALLVAISRTLGQPQDVLNEVAIRTMHALLHQRAQLERVAQAERDEAAKRAAAEAMRDAPIYSPKYHEFVDKEDEIQRRGGIIAGDPGAVVATAPAEPEDAAQAAPDDAAAVEASFAKSPPGTPTPIYEFTTPANSKPFTAKVD